MKDEEKTNLKKSQSRKKQTVQLSNAIRIVNTLKEFEQRRLIGASAFVAPAVKNSDSEGSLPELEVASEVMVEA